jgi:hypothetical protein
VILSAGSRLEANATYVNLRDPQLREIKAEGKEEVGEADLIIPKSEVDYELWNKLIGSASSTVRLT